MQPATGRVVQVIGPVVDVEFTGDIPRIHTALSISNPAINDEPDNLVVEVALHLGEHLVRCVAMDTTEGLVRGMPVNNTGAPISVPVGPEVLGRIMNVVGRAVDGGSKIKTVDRHSIHRDAPGLAEQSGKVEVFETGLKVVDLLSPYPRGGKVGLF